MLNLITEFLGWFIVSAVLMSFIEHGVHRYLMHRKGWLCRFSVIRKIFDHHAVLHHGQYHKQFRDEPVERGMERGLKLSVREGFFEALPVSALIAIFSWPCAVTFVAIVCLHHKLWNLIHLEMHKPENRFFADYPIFQYLARHHYLHHRHGNTNFNVVLPLADYMLGTVCKPSRSDLRGMYRMGLRKRKPVLALALQPMALQPDTMAELKTAACASSSRSDRR